VFDAYTRAARMAPAVLAGLPALAVLIAGATSPWTPLRAGGSLAGCVGLVVVALVRDRGRMVEARLWGEWGGAPTTERLRWRGNEQAQVVLLHERVEKATGSRLPDASSEEADRAEADARYVDAVGVLRELTRDQNRFPLVFRENVNYGWRRNSLGLRPIAITIAGLALLMSAVFLGIGHGNLGGRSARWIPSLLVAAFALAWWGLVVSDRWIRTAADLYADRLFEAVHTLARDG